MKRLLLTCTALASATPVAAQITVPSTITIIEGEPWAAKATRVGPKSVTVPFTFRTIDDTAIAGQDYVARSGNQSIRKNAMTYTVNGLSIDDDRFESDKRFVLEWTPQGQSPLRTVIVIRDNDPPPPVPCPDGTSVPFGQTCPEPPHEHPPEPTGWIPSPSPTGLAGIPSNFEPQLATIPIAATAAPDIVGAFRFTCTAGQLLRDDPIVYPGQPGKSHLHQFFGNTAANAGSTYESLRTSGESTCLSPLNRSAYWMPAMLDGKGNVVRPDHGQIYYKNYPASSPRCQGLSGEGEGYCVPLPNGLRFIFGYDMLTSKAPTGSFTWQCLSPTGVLTKHPNMDEAMAAPACTPAIGAALYSEGRAPACWDGKNLDSPNHRDHMSYMLRGSDGKYRCPATHPKLVPAFTQKVKWLLTPGTEPKLWRLSSDEMRPELPRGTTFHADWFGAWDNIILGMWTDNCINRLLSCAAGNLGNGKMMKQVGPTVTPEPRLVPIP